MKNQIFSFSLMSLVLGACTDDEKNTVWSAGGPSAKEGWDIFTGEGTATVPRSSSMQIVRSTHGSRHREISTTERGI